MMKQTLKTKGRYGYSQSPKRITNDELWAIIQNYKSLKEEEKEKMMKQMQKKRDQKNKDDLVSQLMSRKQSLEERRI